MNNNPHYTQLSKLDVQQLINSLGSYTQVARRMLWNPLAFSAYCRKYRLALPVVKTARNSLAQYSDLQLEVMYKKHNSFTKIVLDLQLSCSKTAVMKEFLRRGIKGLHDRVLTGVELGKSNLGRSQSSEERDKHRQGVKKWLGHAEHMARLKNLHTGFQHTEATKQKMSLAAVNRPNFKGESKLEKKFREALEVRKLVFVSQYSLPVARSIADFFFAPNLAVYVDGCFVHACSEHHPELLDWKYVQGKRRLENVYTRSTKNDPNVRVNLEKAGYTVLRFWEHEVNTDLPGCISKIEQATATK